MVQQFSRKFHPEIWGYLFEVPLLLLVSSRSEREVGKLPYHLLTLLVSSLLSKRVARFSTWRLLPCFNAVFVRRYQQALKHS